MTDNKLKALTPYFISTIGVTTLALGIFFVPEDNLDNIANLSYLCISGSLALAEPVKDGKKDDA